MFAGAASAAHESQFNSIRPLCGSTANTRTAVVELVRNAAPICPNPISVAIVSPAAGRDRGA